MDLFHDSIEIIQVIGIPHPKFQETVAMVVKLKRGKRLTLAEVKAACSETMEWPKIPRHLEIIDDFSPFMTVTGKIKKYKLKAYLEAKLQPAMERI